MYSVCELHGGVVYKYSLASVVCLSSVLSLRRSLELCNLLAELLLAAAQVAHLTLHGLARHLELDRRPHEVTPPILETCEVLARILLEHAALAVHLGHILLEGGQRALQLGNLRVELVVADKPRIRSVLLQNADVVVPAMLSVLALIIHVRRLSFGTHLTAIWLTPIRPLRSASARTSTLAPSGTLGG